MEDVRVLASVVGELADDATPQGTSAQLAALAAVFAECGLDYRPEAVEEVDVDLAASCARDLLDLLAAEAAARPALEEWTRHPPEQEAAALPHELTTGIVLTGCFVVLQIVTHLSATYQTGKGWKVSYDPTRRSQLLQVMTRLVGVLTRLSGQSPPNEPLP
jgi:hypothetical protein